MLPAVNQVHISVRLRAGSAPGETRIGEGWHLRQINVKGLTFSFIAASKQPFGGDGVILFSCLSGCHLCFNLLLYFSKPNRETLSCLFMLHFPFSPITPRLSPHPLRRNLLHRESQLRSGGACLPCTISYGHAYGLYLPGWMAVSPDHLFSFPCVVVVSWLSLKRQVAKVKVFVTLTGKDWGTGKYHHILLHSMAKIYPVLLARCLSEKKGDILPGINSFCTLQIEKKHCWYSSETSDIFLTTWDSGYWVLLDPQDFSLP